MPRTSPFQCLQQHAVAARILILISSSFAICKDSVYNQIKIFGENYLDKLSPVFFSIHFFKSTQKNCSCSGGHSRSYLAGNGIRNFFELNVFDCKKLKIKRLNVSIVSEACTILSMQREEH